MLSFMNTFTNFTRVHKMMYSSSILTLFLIVSSINKYIYTLISIYNIYNALVINNILLYFDAHIPIWFRIF